MLSAPAVCGGGTPMSVSCAETWRLPWEALAPEPAAVVIAWRMDGTLSAAEVGARFPTVTV